MTIKGKFSKFLYIQLNSNNTFLTSDPSPASGETKHKYVFNLNIYPITYFKRKSEINLNLNKNFNNGIKVFININ